MNFQKRFQHQNYEAQKGFSYDASHRKSFFQKSFVRMEWSRRKMPKISQEFDLQVEVNLVSKQNTLKQKYFSVWQNIIITQKKNGEKCWLDFENSIYIPIEDEHFGVGLKLIKCFDELLIFGDIETLCNHMKRYTIQLDFQNNYNIMKKISQIDVIPSCQKEIFKINNKKDHRDYQCIVYQKNQIGLELERQIEKQIYILRRINYDYLQKFYGIFEDKEQIIIITELMIGGTLDSYVRKFPLLTEEKACKLFFKLFKALAYLHSKNIMHRDLKPENIMLSLNGNLDYPIINQFAFAELLSKEMIKGINDSDDETIPEYLNKRYGTPGYTAPEILRSDFYDFKIDVFSMGIILYFTMTGKIPFESKNIELLIEENRICEIDYSKLFLSDEGLQFIKSILNQNQNERLSAQLAVNHTWFKQERISEVNEHKASNKLKQFAKKPSFRIKQNSPNSPYMDHQRTLTQDSSPLSVDQYHSPQDHFKYDGPDFKMKTQSNTFTPEITRKHLLIKQSSFGRRSQQFSPAKLSPLNLSSHSRIQENDKAHQIKTRLKKSIFNQS